MNIINVSVAPRHSGQKCTDYIKRLERDIHDVGRASRPQVLYLGGTLWCTWGMRSVVAAFSSLSACGHHQWSSSR